jgi:hypothetical protein
MFGLASTTHGELLGTIHAIDGMCFIRSGDSGMTYTTTMNNAKHDNNGKLNYGKHNNGKHNKHNNGKQINDKDNNGKLNYGKHNNGKHNNEQWQG